MNLKIAKQMNGKENEIRTKMTKEETFFRLKES